MGVMVGEAGIGAVVLGVHLVAPAHGTAAVVADADMVDVEGVEYIWVLPLADEPPGHLLRLGIDRLALGLMENGTKLWALCEFGEQDEAGEGGGRDVAVDHAFVRLKEFVDELFSCHYGGMVYCVTSALRGAVQRYDFLVEGSRSSSEKSFKIASKSSRIGALKGGKIVQTEGNQARLNC